MKISNIDQVIKDFNALIPEEQEYTINIIQKIMIDSKRETLSSRANKAVLNLGKGKVKHGSAKDLLNDLEHD